MPINVISKLKPINNGQFPVVEDVDISGGYQIRADLPDRDAIPTSNRKEGMLVFVQSDSTFYTLSGGITNSDWATANLGGGGGSTVVFKPGAATSAPNYATWPEVVDAAFTLSASSNAVTILIDASLGTCDIQAGSWDFGANTTLAGIESQPFPQLHIFAGTSFVNSPVAYKNLDIFSQSDSIITSVPPNFNILIEDTTFETTATPLYNVTNDLFLNIYGFSIIGSGSGVIFATTGNLLLYAYDGTKVLDDALSAGSYTVRMFSGAAHVSLIQNGPLTFVSDDTVDLDVLGSGSFGPTSSRPVMTTSNPGFRFFDTDIARPLVWDGGTWTLSNIPIDYPGSSVGQQRVQGVSVTPGWTVVGGFKFIQSRVAGTLQVTLQIILAPSTTALTCRARIVNSATLIAVTGSTVTVSAGSISDQYVSSGNIAANLVDNTLYQIQVECTGGALTTDFVTVRSGSLVVV